MRAACCQHKDISRICQLARLIYRVSEASKEEIEKVKQDIATIKAKLSTLPPAERLMEEARLRSLEIRLADLISPASSSTRSPSSRLPN